MRLRPGGTKRLQRIAVTQTGRLPQIRKCTFFECRVSNHVSVHLHRNSSLPEKIFSIVYYPLNDHHYNIVIFITVLYTVLYVCVLLTVLHVLHFLYDILLRPRLWTIPTKVTRLFLQSHGA